MKRHLLAILGLACGVSPCSAADFEPPVRVKADGAFVRVESPGYAAPCLTDVDGDGKPDLVVGQFNKGKVRVYKGQGGGKFAAGDWLKTGDVPAEVPGVW